MRHLGQESRFFRCSPTPDFNQDGLIDCVDVDRLVAEIVAGTNDIRVDLTGDGVVDTADLEDWRDQAGAANLPSGNPYLLGDANLDGTVDAEDFIIWNSHKFSDAAAWCSGDLNADGFVDGQDFVLWNAHNFMSSDQVSLVPEPATFTVASLSFVLLEAAGRAVWRNPASRAMSAY